MRIALTERFQRDAGTLSKKQRSALFEVILALPKVVGKPHLHQGVGVRKIHASGVWEARVGLGLRLVFALEPDRISLVWVGTHDDVRRFLREL